LPEGRRSDEAQMVYQFPLAPLVLHSFHTGSAQTLTDWADSLDLQIPGTSFFNFTASHDGIGVRPAEGLLSPTEMHNLADRVRSHGGQVSYKNNPDGTQSPYELNLTWYDALNDPSHPDHDLDIQRFMASQIILLSLAGVPGVYVHSLFGSRSCTPCFMETGRARSLNREKFNLANLQTDLEDPTTNSARIFARYTHLLKIRKQQPAFNPFGKQNVLRLSEKVFSILRSSVDSRQSILCLINVSDDQQQVEIPSGMSGHGDGREWLDLIAGQSYSEGAGGFVVGLQAYQAVWLLASAEV
jgi:glucosylglycerate phosphorylase